MRTYGEESIGQWRHHHPNIFAFYSLLIMLGTDSSDRHTEQRYDSTTYHLALLSLLNGTCYPQHIFWCSTPVPVEFLQASSQALGITVF